MKGIILLCIMKQLYPVVWEFVNLTAVAFVLHKSTLSCINKVSSILSVSICVLFPSAARQTSNMRPSNMRLQTQHFLLPTNYFDTAQPAWSMLQSDRPAPKSVQQGSHGIKLSKSL